MTDASLPLIDVSSLVAGTAGRDAVAEQIGAACRAHGFFYVTGHGVDAALVRRLEALSHRFFELPEETKMQWRMALGGRAWRGFFPLGGELTSGRPDWKEGLYLGTELPATHPLVRAKTPVHGPNLFPDVPGFRETILDYMAAVTRLGHRLMEGIALSLGLPAGYFAERYTGDPLILFRLCPRGWTCNGAWASTPTTGCSRSCTRTTSGASRCTRPAAGSTRRRFRARSSATSATCSTA